MKKGIFLWLIGVVFYVGISVADVSICDITQGIGVVPGDTVSVTGICTVPSERFGNVLTIITQEGGGPWCSIRIYEPDEMLVMEIGQCITLTGTIEEYYGKYEIITSSIDEVWECGWQIPDPLRLEPPLDLQSLIDCTCVWEGLTVATVPDEYGSFDMVDRYGTTWTALLRLIDPVPPVGTEICSVLGWMDYSFDMYRARPIDSDSIDNRAHDNCPWMGTACDEISTRTFLSPPSDTCFIEGDEFHYTVTWTNLCEAREVDPYIALRVEDLWVFFPSWNNPWTADKMFPELGSFYWDVFLFEHPGVIEELDCSLFALALKADTYELLGDFSEIRFCMN